MSAGWIQIEKIDGNPIVKKKVDSIVDTVKDHLVSLNMGNIKSVPDAAKNEYKKRKLIQEVTIKSYLISKGPDFSLTLQKLETDLTAEMIASGSWKDLKFKAYNFDSLGKFFSLFTFEQCYFKF